jgi:hypothetical protein
MQSASIELDRFTRLIRALLPVTVPNHPLMNLRSLFRLFSSDLATDLDTANSGGGRQGSQGDAGPHYLKISWAAVTTEMKKRAAGSLEPLPENF